MSQILLSQKLKDLLVIISEGERNLDRQRELLCELPTFTPYNSFHALDRLSLNYLTHTDIHNLFQNQKMSFSYEDTCLLLKNIDKNSDLKIMFEEWEDLLLCRRKKEVRQLVMEREAKIIGRDDRVMSQIVMVLQQIVRNAKDYDLYRQRLRCTPDFSEYLCFNQIDTEHKGIINFKDIDRFLKERGKFLTEEEILLLISFADVDQDDALSFQEFTQLLIVGVPAPLQTSPKKSRIIYSPSTIKYQIENSGSQILPLMAREIASPNKQQQIQPVSFKNNPPLISPVKLSRIYQTTRQFSSSKKNTMQQLEENDQVIQWLKKMIQYDRELQETKIKLTFQSDFNLMDLFRIFDLNYNEKISKIELEQGLNSIGIFPTTDQLFLFLEEFDQNNDGIIDFGDFAKIFYTGEQYQSKVLNDRQPQYIEPLEGETIYNVFSAQTQGLLKNLFHQIFDQLISLERFRESLQLRPNFNLYEAFNFLSNSFNELTYEQFKETLQRYGVFTSENEIVKLFSKMDKNKDGIVKLDEFAQEIRAKSPGQKFNK